LVWDYQNQSSPTAIDVPIGESIAAWTSDGDLYLADGTGRTWAAAGDKKHEAPGGMDDRLLNRRLFAVGGARATRLWCASSGVGSGSQPARLMLGRGDQAIALGNCDRDVRVLAVSQQGRWGAVARDNGEIVLWDLDRRRKGPSLAGPGPQSVDVAFADNDQWIVGLFSDRRIRLWQSGNAFKERVSVSLGDLDVTGVIPARGSWPGLVLVTKDGLLELDLSKPTTPAPDR
jgi:WD40 repeat protein